MRTPKRCSPFVSSKKNLWQLDGIARRYGQRPSALLGLPGESWTAWQVDRAAWEFGTWLDAMLEVRDAKGVLKHKLSELLADKQEERDRSFAPVSRPGVKKMAIPESGVW